MRQTIREHQYVIGPGDGYSLLHAFAKRGRTSVVEFVLEKGADPNAKDSDGVTPLIRAAIEGHGEMVLLLLKRGADIEAPFKGNTALIEATLQNNYDIVYLLIENGANKEAKTKDGHTALHLAAANAYLKIVEILVDAGADINTKDNKLITPLMSAALCNKLWMVEWLLNRGADVGAKDKDGETALTLHQNKSASRILTLHQLYERRNTQIAKLLESEMDRQRRVRRSANDGIRINGKEIHAKEYCLPELELDGTPMEIVL